MCTTWGHQRERWDFYVRLRVGSARGEIGLISIRSSRGSTTKKGIEWVNRKRDNERKELVIKGMTYLKHIEK